MCKVSVIVPIYNVEKFLNECVENILNQTYRDFELILVDDGSTDNCSSICDDLQKIDNRINVIHKANGGLSSARNAGIEVAKGELITFIDSDDLISEIYLEQLVFTYEQSSCDIVVSGISSSLKKLNCRVTDKSKICLNNKALKYLLKEKISTSACGKLFVKSLFDKINFPEGKIYEDYATIPKIFGVANNVALVDKALYYYRPNDTSITGTIFSDKRMQYFEIAEDIIKFLDKSYPKYKKNAYCRNTRYAISFFRQIAKSGFKDESIEKFLVLYVRKNIFRYVFTTRYSVLSKFYGLAIFVCPRLAKKI